MKKRDKSTMFYICHSCIHLLYHIYICIIYIYYTYIYTYIYICIIVDDIGECQKKCVVSPSSQSCLRTAQVRLSHTPHVTLIQMKFKIQCIRFLKYLYNYVIMLIAGNSQESSDILCQVAQW